MYSEHVKWAIEIIIINLDVEPAKHVYIMYIWISFYHERHTHNKAMLNFSAIS